MTDENPTAPPPDRHPRTGVTRLPYLLVLAVVLLAAVVWGAVTMRERASAGREIVGMTDNGAHTDQAITNPSAK